jgi:hypothetical protein
MRLFVTINIAVTSSELFKWIFRKVLSLDLLLIEKSCSVGPHQMGQCGTQTAPAIVTGAVCGCAF